MPQLFSCVIVEDEDVCAARPLALFTRNFGAHDCLLVPDSQGGFDFKFLVTYDCGVEILAEYASRLVRSTN
jgi:hypothetical protein